MTTCTECGYESVESAKFCGACGGPFAVAQLRAGTYGLAVGAYRMFGALGSGASSRVWLAYDVNGAPVAVKSLHPSLIGSPDLHERFRAEARILRQLAHPNIVRFIDFLEDSANSWIVMEYVDGSTLREVEDVAGRLQPEQAFGVLEGCLFGLSEAHGAGIVHGDIKPQNILVDKFGVSKLTDFGASRSWSNLPQGSGTPQYMSPEGARGLPVDQRSDIYSMGIVLYEALAGQPPFRATSELAVLRMHANDEPAQIGGIPSSVNEVLLSALAKDPASRPQSASEFRQTLDVAAVTSFGPSWRTVSSIALLSASVAATAMVSSTAGSTATSAAFGTESAAEQTSVSTTHAVNRFLGSHRTGHSIRLTSTKIGGAIANRLTLSAFVSVVVVTGAVAGGLIVARSLNSAQQLMTHSVIAMRTLRATQTDPEYAVQITYPWLTGESLVDHRAASTINSVLLRTVDADATSFEHSVSGGVPTPQLPTETFLRGWTSSNVLGDGLVSYTLVTERYYAGAAHPGEETQTLTFSASTGQPISLEDLFSPYSKWLEAISTDSYERLPSSFHLEPWFNSGSAPTLSNFAAWAPTPWGLSITFQEYQVGPYSDGMPQVTIPYTDLSPYIVPHGLVQHLESAPPLRTVLIPATTTPVVNECNEPLLLKPTAPAEPVTCGNGSLNITAWQQFSNSPVLSLGANPSVNSVIRAMCSYSTTNDGGGTPDEWSDAMSKESEQAAALYYGWHFVTNEFVDFTADCQTARGS